MKTLYTALALLAFVTTADAQGEPVVPRAIVPPPAPPEFARPGYVTCAIAEWCLGNDRKWTSSVRGARGLHSTPPRPVPGAPFERNPDDRGD
jgi:hypothetical protein